MMDILATALTVYLVLFIIKFVLALSSFPAAMAAYSYAMTGKRFDLYASLVTLVLLPVTLFIHLIPTMKAEGWKFFLVYSNKSTIRQVFTAIRDANKEMAE